MTEAGSREPFVVAEHTIAAGRRVKLELPIAKLVSGTPVALPVLVLHGKLDGPTMWLSAALHGDELCGVEIIRRLLELLDPMSMRGTVIAVPVVNVHGFNRGERSLPDGRDLNRSFPGSARGSLASRLAHLMMSEVVSRCEFGIDLHTGSDHRVNLPQIRGDLDDPRVLALANVFAAPVSLHSWVRDGSLRQAATEAGATALLYEGGEADRFDEDAIIAGTHGCLRVMASQGIIDGAPESTVSTRPLRSSKWMRATRSGILHVDFVLGDEVLEGQTLATVHDPFGKRLGAVRSRASGVVIGQTQRPLVNRGDAVVHVAEAATPQHDA